MNKENKSKMVGVKLTPQEIDVLNNICDTLNISKSVFIRRLINNYLVEMCDNVR